MGVRGQGGQHTSLNYIGILTASPVTLATQPFHRPCLGFSGVASAQVSFDPSNLGFGFWKQLQAPWVSRLRRTLGNQEDDPW